MSPGRRHPPTRAESSRFRETSLHGDVMRFLGELGARGDRRLVLSSFGMSPEGRDLPFAVLSARGIATPEQARASGLPVVLVINGIHAGEVEGKEALLALMRDLLDGEHASILEQLVLVVVPLFNPDGNDRIDPKNRALDLAHFEGQIGPETGVGTRTNASGINLNRDYMRQDAPEMRLLQSRVCRPWQPHLTIDTHSTNGSVHRFALTYDVPHTVDSGRPEPIEYMRQRFLPEVTRRVKRRTDLDCFWYGNFVEDEGQSGEGWMTYTHHPRFGSHYRGLTNRLDLLIETYSYQPFEARVFATYEFVVEALELAAERASELLDVVARSQAPRDSIAVRYRLEAFPGKVEILTRKPRTLEGAPIAVQLPHLARFVGTRVVERPFGYAVPPRVAEHLARHGLSLEPAPKEARVAVATVEAVETTGERKILEASASGEARIAVSWSTQTRALDPSWSVVRTDTPLGAVAVYLCEPESDDGLVQCAVLPAPKAGDEFPVLRVLEPPRVT